MRFLNIKTIIFLVMFIFGLALSMPSIFGIQGPKITLGLDLQGGLNILLGVNTNEAIKSKYSSIATQINHDTQNSDILIDSLRANDASVSFQLLDISKKDALDKMLSNIKGLDINNVDGKYNIVFTQEEIKFIKSSSIEQAIDTIRNRLDIFGLSEPSVSKQGENNILVQLSQDSKDLLASEISDLDSYVDNKIEVILAEIKGQIIGK